jgi:hypothetical protein
MLLFSVAFFQLVTSSAWAANLNVVPRPQEMHLSGQPISLMQVKVIFPKTISILPVLWQETLEAHGVSTLCENKSNLTICFLMPGTKESQTLLTNIRDKIADQGYLIRRQGNEMQVAANTATGLVYALYTLNQLITGYGEAALLQPAEVTDWPDFSVRGVLYLPPQIDRLAYYRYLARYKMNYGCYYIDETVPVSPEVGKVIADLAERGMKVVPVMSWFTSQRFQYSDDKYVQMVLDRVREIGSQGAKAIGLNFDDMPCELKYDADKAKYKTLADAHVDLMRKVCKVAERYGMDVFFTPTIYWPVDASRQNQGLENAYQQTIARGLPTEVKIFNTSESAAEWQIVKKNFGERKWVLWHNYFPNDMSERKIYFQTYQLLGEQASEFISGVWVLGPCGNTDVFAWYPNWVGEAANTWNRHQMIGFKEMFDRVYGLRFADKLTLMAKLIAVPDNDEGKTLGGMKRMLSLQTKVLLGIRGGELQKRLRHTTQAVKILEEIKTQLSTSSQETNVKQNKEFYQDLPIDMLLGNCKRLQGLYALAECIEKIQSINSGNPQLNAAMKNAYDAVDTLEKIDRGLGMPNVDIDNVDGFKNYLKELAGKSGMLIGRSGKKQNLADMGSFFNGYPLAEKFYTLTLLGEAKNPTAVWAYHDDTTLYLAIECKSTNVSQVRAQVTTQDGNVYEDDSVEFFLCPKPNDLSDFYQIAVNSRGVVMDKHGIDSGWNSGAKVKVRNIVDGWRAVVAIPVRTLDAGLSQIGGQTWQINICRNAVTKEAKTAAEVKEYSTWMPVSGTSFYSPSSMAAVKFE